MSRISRIVQRLKEHKRQADLKTEAEQRKSEPWAVSFGEEDPEVDIGVDVGRPASYTEGGMGEPSPAASVEQQRALEAQRQAEEELRQAWERQQQLQQLLQQPQQPQQPQQQQQQQTQSHGWDFGTFDSSLQVDPRLAPRQQQLKGDPFAIKCPYSSACGLMEARDLPTHAREYHQNDAQGYPCPICMLSAEDQSMVERTNLLQHLAANHSDCVPSWEDNPLDASPNVDMRNLKVAGAFVEDVLQTAVAKECPICFDEFAAGEAVYRMDCWCLFHKHCAQSWFDKVGNCRCPVHAD